MSDAVQPSRTLGLRFAGALVAAIALFALYRVGRVDPPPPKTGLIWRTGYPQSAGDALERLKKLAEQSEASGDASTNDWFSYQAAAGGWTGVARLTGDPRDFARADTALAKAFKVAIPGSGPNDTRATFEFAVHRLDRATAALDMIDRYAAPDPDAARAEHVAMRADIAFFRGRTEDARRLHAQAQALSAGPETLCRAAQIEWRTGEIGKADETLDRCEASVPMRTPQFAAYVAVQHALIALNRGDWPGALARFRRAELVFPGDWKTQLRIAMMQAAMGEQVAAREAMESLARPDTRPEVDDSLANFYRLTGDGNRARAAALRAGAKWRAYVAAFPEAFWGHARDHELAFGNPKAALGYAVKDVRNRPYGEPLIGLARAWIANGRPDYALALLAKVDRTGWTSPETERVRAEALAFSGKPDASEVARKAALAMDPHVYDPARGFIWLDH